MGLILDPCLPHYDACTRGLRFWGQFPESPEDATLPIARRRDARTRRNRPSQTGGLVGQRRYVNGEAYHVFIHASPLHCLLTPGLLVDASRPHSGAGSYRVLVTNDITPLVLKEAAELGTHLLLSYHPTPFSAMKRFDPDESHAANVVLTAAREGFAIYSPHTALDSVPQGLNDWLVDAIVARAWGAPAVAAALRAPVKPSKDATWAALGAGDGRVLSGLTPLPLASVVAAVKDALALPFVQLALPAALLAETRAGAAATMTAAGGVTVRSVAVCAGSGGAVLSGCAADVWVTGEMSHHEVLAAAALGRSVILTHHSNCERGFLPRLRDALLAGWGRESAGATPALPPLEVSISRVDADPLVIV